MPEYTVTWTIQVEAESPEDAAEQARMIQLDPENIATVFDVEDEASGATVRVDFDPR